MKGQAGSPEIPDVGAGKRGLEGHLLYLLRQANAAALQAVDRELAELGLSFPQYSALTMINAYPRLSSAQLARISMLTAQSAHEVVQRLMAAGWIGKAEHAGRGRAVPLEITVAGRALLAKARKRTDRIEALLAESADMAGGEAIRRWLVDTAVRLSRE